MNNRPESPPFRQRLTRKTLRKGIYVLPTMLTLGSIFASFHAIIHMLEYYQAPKAELLTRAAYLIILAAVLDMFDGKVAKLTNTATAFGVQIDSLADAISFGVAPALLMYVWGLHIFGNQGILGAFLFVMGGVLRLARFNVQTGYIDPRFFVGLPIPMAAGTLMATLLNFPWLTETRTGTYTVLFVTVGLSILMVSGVRYRTFKEIDFRERQPIRVFATIIGVICLLILHFEWAFLFITYTMVISGLVSPLLPSNWDWKRVGIDPANIDAVLDDAMGVDIEEEELEPPHDEPLNPPPATH